MPNLAPIDYGQPVQVVDQRGSNALLAAVDEQGRKRHAAMDALGTNIENTAQTITQGLLHNQALKATAAAKESQSELLKYIETNPYVSKEDLRQRMSPEDYDAWHAKLDPEYRDRDTVPMYKAASELFDSGSKRARDEFSQYISTPGWRERWALTDQAETTNFKSDRLNRVVAGQMVNDQRAEAKTHLDKLLASATDTKDIELAIRAMRGNMFLHPAERDALEQDARKVQDRLPSTQAMAGLDVPGMKTELTKLENPDTAKQFYGHMADDERVHLQTQLRSHINLVENMKSAADDLEEKRRKLQDDRTLGGMADSLAHGGDPSTLLSYVTQRQLEDKNDSKSSGFYATPKMLEAYHLLETALKNAKEGPQQDAPGALRAITQLFADTQDLNGDAFRKAMLTPGGVDIPGYGHLNPETDLSSASFKAQLSRLDTLASTDRGRVEREREAGHQMRVTSVLLENGIAVTELTNPLVRPKYDRMIAFLEDAVKRKAQSRGRVLSPDEETVEMAKAAKVFKDNAGNWGPFGYFNNAPGKDGINIETKRGTVAVGAEELATLHTTARELGAPLATVSSAALKSTVKDFYENYEAPARSYWKKQFGEDISLEDQYRVYWRAKKFMDTNIPAATRVQTAIMQVAKEDAIKRQGGQK
jgi:hypothetical protein